MAEYLIQDTTLLAIADAIRSKSGKADTILVSDMATEILNLEAGGISEMFLYNAGDTCDAVTGGWTSYDDCTVTFNTDNMYLTTNKAYTTSAGVRANNLINLTNHNTIVFNSSGTDSGFALQVVDNSEVVASASMTNSGSIDVSSLSGYYTIKIHCSNGGSSGRKLTVNNIKLAI